MRTLGWRFLKKREGRSTKRFLKRVAPLLKGEKNDASASKATLPFWPEEPNRVDFEVRGDKEEGSLASIELIKRIRLEKLKKSGALPGRGSVQRDEKQRAKEACATS
jgi:hypothetical protein